MVETEARDWEANKRDAAMLLQGPKLAKALVDTGAEFDGGQLTTRVDLNESARDFLTWSQEAERTKKARARKRRVGLVALLSVITLVAVMELAGRSIGSKTRRKVNGMPSPSG